MHGFRFKLAFALLLTSICVQAQLQPDGAAWDEERALRHSQQAIGRALSDQVLTRADGRQVSLSDYAGKPLLLSLIFTSCHHVCPVTTKRLGLAVEQAREALGEDAFKVVTIGFDTANDTPKAMLQFRRQQGIDQPGWDFLSAEPEVIEALTRELGFIYFRSPRGFDHITQVTVVDRDGVVYRQVYGMQFELPWLVEPLKELVFDRKSTLGDPLSGLLDRVRLFCTVYDPASGHYRFDYSLFIQMAIGLAAILGVLYFLISGWRRTPRGGG